MSEHRDEHSNGPSDQPNAAYRASVRTGRAFGPSPALLGLAVAIALLVWIGAINLGRPRPPSASFVLGSIARPSATGPASFESPVASGLPGVDVRIAAASIGRIPAWFPVGLGWIDPIAGTASFRNETSRSQATWLFQTSSGEVLCACLESGLASEPRTLTFAAIAPDNTTQVLATIPGFLPPLAEFGGDPHDDADVVFDGPRSTFLAATLALADPGWRLTLRRIPLDPSLAMSERSYDLGSLVDLLPLDVGELRIALNPDATLLEVTVEQPFGDLSVPPRDWLVATDGGSFGGLRPNPFGTRMLTSARCDVRAWATDTVFVQACQSVEPQPDSPTAWVVRLERPGESPRDLPIDTPADTQWLVDGTNGVVYGWSASGSVAVRVDARTGAVLQRPLDPGGNGVSRELPIPGGPVRWQPTISSWESEPRTLVGSPDGQVLYAVGTLATPGQSASTGITLIDPTDLSEIRHLPATLEYEALGLTGDGQALIGIGRPTPVEQARYGDFDEGLAVLDVRSGAVQVIDRDLLARFGDVPDFLPLPPG